jgi:hypothetical protein
MPPAAPIHKWDGIQLVIIEAYQALAGNFQQKSTLLTSSLCEAIPVCPAIAPLGFPRLAHLMA